jgi:hypothetical protein
MRLRKRAKKQDRSAELLMVVPPRTGERTLLAVENLLQAMAVEEPFSLELAGTGDGVSFLVRTRSPVVFRQQLAIHYPQARIQALPPEDDPLRLRPGERAWTRILTTAGPEFLPLRTFRDDDLLDPGSDPLLAVLGALGAVEQGERLIARLVLRSLGPDWSLQYQRRALVPALSPVLHPSYQYQTRPLKMEGIGLMLLLLPLLLGLQNYVWLREGAILKAVLLDMGAAAGVAMAVPLVWRWLRNAGRIYDNRLVQEKVSRSAFLAELHLTAVIPEGRDPRVAENLLQPLATAYHHYDLASGNRFKDGKLLGGVPQDPLALSGRKPWQGRSVLNTRELATLWHPPRGGDEVPLLERTGARYLHPLARGVRHGALVGEATSSGRGQAVRFPDDLLRQHHLYVAKTRMGKSTLMQHVAAYKMRRKAEGKDPDAIVIIDPHSDLVRALLTLVPRELVEEVYLIDLADFERVPGVNLLDTHLFPDRDRATDNVIQVVKNLWEQWGPRMQSILEHTLKSLYDANRHPSVPRERQYTILDGLHLLSDEGFRREVLSKVQDPYLVRWWARDFRDWHRQYRADAVAPVQTRLAYYASSERARAILGQPASTLDLSEVVRQGKVLLVNTAQGQVGREVAALIGGTLLNLLDGVIRAQEALPPRERRRVLVVVDEMQAIPGADYEAMLSELGKFGASFVMATQSLARLEELGETLRETLFSNIGCLVAFQVSAHDARYLTWELDRDQVSEADLTSLPAHHCYVRATVGGEKLPTFSMALRPPEPGDPQVAAMVRSRADLYTRPRQEVATRLERELEKFISEYRQDLQQAQPAQEATEADNAASQGQKGRRKQRSHRKRQPTLAGGGPFQGDEVDEEKEGHS